jgi:hypothetical protein
MMKGEGLQLVLNADELRKRAGDMAHNFETSHSKLVLAAKYAADDTLEHVRALSVKGIRSTYFVKAGDLRKRIFLQKARADKGGVRARLTFYGNLALSLTSFGAKKTKTGISVRILKERGRRMIRPGGEKFIKRTEKGRAAVWIAKGHVVARTDTRDHPVVLRGPSFLSWFKRPGVYEQLAAAADAKFYDRLIHHAGMVLQGIGLKTYDG